MLQPELQARLQVVRSHYLVTPWIRPRSDESPLLRSWQRCRDAGLREVDRIQFELVSRSLLAELDDRHGDLVERARPEVDRLAASLQSTRCAVVLVSPKGYIFDRRVHEASSPAALLASTRVGINLAERCVGTTAPCIAMADGEPYLVGREAHFCANVRPFFCVAAPIYSPQGDCIGALDITAFDNVPGFDVLSLVADAASAISNRLFDVRPDRLLLRFHARQELVGTPLEAIIEVDQRGQVVGANRAAGHALCRKREQLLGARFVDLFDRDITRAFSMPGSRSAELLTLHTGDGLLVHAHLEGAGLAHRAASRGWQVPTAPSAAPKPVPGGAALTSMREVEWAAIDRTLQALDGNVAATARHLGISRNTIYRRRAARA